MSSAMMPRSRYVAAVALLLALVVPRAVCAADTAESKRLVAVIVVDSLDKSIGKAVAKDGERVRQSLADGFAKDKNRLVLAPPVDGAKVTPDDVLKFIDKLEVNKDDTLLFFYSGHGASNKEKGQYFQMYSGPENKKGDLLRKTLENRLKAKNARLTVLLTNICNVDCPFLAPLTRDLSKPPNYQVMRSLFLLPKGMVNITSSKEGEFSWNLTGGGDIGGLFTFPLVNLLRYDRLKPGQVLTWDVAFDALREATQKDYTEFREAILASYNKVPANARTDHQKDVAKILREQPRQTVLAYELPGR